MNDSQLENIGMKRINRRFVWQLVFFFFFTILLSIGLAWVSTQFRGIQGWSSFLAILLIGAGILWAGWRLIQVESPPPWLAYLTIAAALLRLGAGILWYIAVPVWGHDTPAEQSGYVMSDASKRDQAAWKLSNSNKSLLDAFLRNRAADQYGGMLFLSAIIYRYLGGVVHLPLLIVVLTACFSSLAVLFTWAFARRAWDDQVARLSASTVVIFPEAILLGSSQMREAFTIAFTMAAFYGLLRYRGRRSWGNLFWIIIPLGLFLLFSPPFTALLMGMLGLSALALRRDAHETTSRKWFWVVLLGLVILVIIGLWLALSQFTPEGMSNPVEMLSWWLRKSAEFQARLTRLASGWLQKTFKSTPEWTHMPILIGYGTLQPFLPAALTVGSHAPIWPKIVLWRSIGWTTLLMLLFYAPLLAYRFKQVSNFSRVMCLIVWTSIIIAAFRGGGDMWDNPRYRVAFTGLQIALAAWAWIEHRRIGDPWFRRALIAIAAVLIWFVPWYLRRYFGLNWPVSSMLVTLGAGLSSAVILIAIDWLYARKKSHSS